ncbi:MAG TPA: DUF4388 domain-containing protein [Ktedonobacteraceae bacterium]
MPQSISTEPLARMVRSIMLQKRTGILRVEQLAGKWAERGEIYFENGSLVRAYTEREMGKAALQCISEWKQITCSFQSVSRPPYPAMTPTGALPPGSSASWEDDRSPYPATTPIRALPQKQKREDLQSRLFAQTDPLARLPALRDPDLRETSANQPLLDREKTTHPLNARHAEMLLSAQMQQVGSPTNQSLVLHGTRLETYTPEQPARSARSVQYWTTHLASELGTLPMPREISPTQRFDPLVEEKRPGRKAVFKTCAVVSIAQTIRQMERRARLVFILLDGQRTVEDIARLTHQSEYEVEQILINLTQNGYSQYLQG